MNHTNENIMAYVDMIAKKRQSNIHSSKSEYDRFDTKSYYVSNSGNDNNDGLSEETAWATLDKVNSLNDSEKHNILFKRGDTWRGSLMLNGKVTLSAYGEGDKPLFVGSPENGANENKWSLLNGTNNIWVFYKDLSDCGTIVFNDGESCAIKCTPKFNGKYLIDVSKDLNVDLSFFNDAVSIIENGLPKVGDNKNVGKLYLRCDKGNPGSIFKSIEFLVSQTGITATGSHLNINNIALKYYGINGMSAISGISDFIAYMNEISWIGGCINSFVKEIDGSYSPRRGGCGDEVTTDIERHFVDNTWFNQIYEAAVSNKASCPTLQKKIVYSNNLIENCTYAYDYQGQGEDSEKKFNDVTFMSNICRNAGSGWGLKQYPDNALASHIKTWRESDNCGEKLVIRNNIFDHSAGALIIIFAKSNEYLPKLSRNIYIQKENDTLGLYNKDKLLPNDAESQNALLKETTEFGCEFYFA